jgi:hypothetical protein
MEHPPTELDGTAQNGCRFAAMTTGCGMSAVRPSTPRRTSLNPIADTKTPIEGMRH